MNRARFSRTRWSWGLTAFLLCALVAGGIWAAPVPVASAQSAYFAHFTGSLAPGETVPPMSQLFGTPSKNVNLKLQVSAASGSGTINLSFTDGAGAHPFTGTITSGQVLWAPLTLKSGTNTFTLQSPSTNTVSLTYELWLYEVPAAPASWSGVSGNKKDQWQSRLLANFPQSGLYEFSFDLTAGRYQFLLDSDYIQKTVESTGKVKYYVAAGTHELKITPDSAITMPTTTWAVSISAAGAADDAALQQAGRADRRQRQRLQPGMAAGEARGGDAGQL